MVEYDSPFSPDDIDPAADPVIEPELMNPVEPLESEPVVRDLDDTAIKEIEMAQAESKPKKRKPSSSYKLSLSNTLRRNRFYSPPSTDPMEVGGLSCKKCGIMVDHDDYLGTPESGGFKVVGYHCHKCSHRWLRDKYREEETRCGQSYMTHGKWEIKRA